MMKQLPWLLFVNLFAGLWLTLEAAQCRASYRGIATSFCCDTRSGKTCLTTFLDNKNHTVRKPFEEASRWCRSAVPGSSLIIIDSPESKSTLGSFLGGQLFENETIIIDAQKLSGNNSLEWSWVNGHPTVPIDVRTEQSHDGACVESKHGRSLAYCTDYAKSQYLYICEYSDSRSVSSYLANNKSYVASEGVATWYDARNECLRLGGDLSSITDLETIKDWPRLKENQTFRYWIGLHRNKWIWNSTDAALTYTNWNGGYPDESSDKKCICINPQCRGDNNRTICGYDPKWRTCNCSLNYAIVCQTEERPDAFTKEIGDTGEMLPSTSADFNSSVSSSSSSSSSSSKTAKYSKKTTDAHLKTSTARTYPTISSTTTVIITELTTVTKVSNATTPTTTGTSTKTSTATIPTTTGTSTKTSTATTPTTTTISTKTSTATAPITTTTPTKTPIATTPTTVASGKIDRQTASSSTMTENASNHFAENQTTPFASSSTGLFKSFTTGEILLIFLLLVAVVFIVAAVIVIIRKRKYDRRNEELPMTNTKQIETVSSVYATALPVSISSEGTVTPGNAIYTDVEMIKQPTPSNNTIYASVQPTSEAVEKGKSVVYAEVNIPQKDQQKPIGADKITVSLSPIYSQPYEPPTPASNTMYAEPFKADKTHAATAPVLSPIPAVDQQNTYSLAEAIPSGDPSVIYSEVNKPTKSSTPVDKAVKDTDPTYLEAIEVTPGAESGGVAKQDPTAVYAEPIKLKKLP